MPNDAISSIKPAGPTGPEYDLKDANAQTKTLATPITIDGQAATTVEGALDALNNKSGSGTDINGQDTTNVMLVGSSELDD